MASRIIEADCIEAMAEMDEASVDAVVCDPPYGLEFMGKEWDRLGAVAEAATDSPGWRAGHGGSGVASKVGGVPFGGGGNRVRYGADARTMQNWHQAWATQALRVLKPGGHLLAFGGTRTYHRLACAIEDAGFEIRDSVIWIYGSGFPKSLDVSKAIDKGAGAEREVTGKGINHDAKVRHAATHDPDGGSTYISAPDGPLLTAPATPQAQQWQGWGTALKPAHEPIVLARKPLVGTVAANVLEHGTGAINVDGTRIHSAGSEGQPYTVKRLKPGATLEKTGGNWRPEDDEDLPWEAGREYEGQTQDGRWPANCVLSHLPECERVGVRRVKVVGSTAHRKNHDGGMFMPDDEHDHPGYRDPDGTEQVAAWRCAPGCPVAELDRQSGERPGFSGGAQNNAGFRREYAGAEREKCHTCTGTGFDTTDPEDSSACLRCNGTGNEPTWNDQAPNYFKDTGGASRFFLTVQPDRLCVLCGLPSVSPAGNPSSPSESPLASARDNAQDGRPPESEVKAAPSNTSASGAAKRSRTTSATPTDAANDDSAPPDAPAQLADWIVRFALSAGSLCPRCATSTAQSVAQWLTDPIQASDLGAASIVERRRQILSRSLALIAAGSRQTGITPTTAELRRLFGSAGLATEDDIAAKDGGCSRYRYQAKSGRGERNAGLEGFEERDTADLTGRVEGSVGLAGDPNNRGQTGNPYASATGKPRRNGHPTVKPIDLMRWLCRLVTPPEGRILDCFAGSGTTGIAAYLEGFDFIGIEREPEYAEIARARIAWWERVPEGTSVEAALGLDASERTMREAGQDSLFG